MSVALIIIYLSVIVWLFPPFRQYKGNYFFYFLVLSLSDPTSLFLVSQFKVPNNIIHSVSGYGLILSLIVISKTFKTNVKLTVSVSIIFIFCLMYIENSLYIMLIEHVIILVIFIKRAIIPVFLDRIINLFYCALLLYEMSIVLNLALLVGGGSILYLIHYVTLFFQILIAIFFTIYTEKSQSLIIHFRFDS